MPGHVTSLSATLSPAEMSSPGETEAGRQGCSSTHPKGHCPHPVMPIPMAPSPIPPGSGCLASLSLSPPHNSTLNAVTWSHYSFSCVVSYEVLGAKAVMGTMSPSRARPIPTLSPAHACSCPGQPAPWDFPHPLPPSGVAHHWVTLLSPGLSTYRGWGRPGTLWGSWHGDTWLGDSWYGNVWHGDTWYGDICQGDAWYGDVWHRDTWKGDTWCGDTWYGDTRQGDIWNGGAWHGDI